MVDDRAFHDDHLRQTENLEILERVAIEDDQVGRFANGDAAGDLIEVDNAGVGDGRGFESLGIASADVFVEIAEFAPHTALGGEGASAVGS